MNPSRWQQIETLFHAASERAPGERTAFLNQACDGDDELRREVESLLAQSTSPLDRPLLDTVAAPGARLGPYQIEGILGAGGMGKVFRASDTRLGRLVAIKILNEQFGARFEREAKAISSLNHPNICTLFDVGPNYLVMELVDGESLASRLKRGALSIEETLRYGAQAADGLAAAHAKGIIHRDLKPGNIMVTDAGVKILDFGLAKIDVPGEPITLTDGIMGTPAYMAPEQAEGKAADARADLYALGLVLYEMAAGQLPFPGASLGNMLVSGQVAIPPASKGRSGIPAAFDALVTGLLAKSPEARPQTAAAVRDVLAKLSQRAVPRRRMKTVVAAIAAGLVATGAAASLYWFNRSASPMKSIAVLPFVNAGGNPDMDYLSDGITESLINALSRLPNLAVMSRNSVFRYKGRDTDAQAAGQNLKVQAVLTGRVTQRGDRLLISAELIDVRDNRHLWGEQYNRKLIDIFAVQEDISTEISEKLQFPLTGEEKKRLTKRYTQNAEAYQLYLQGRYHWNKKTPEGFQKGIEYFQKAIEADPNYAPAYAGLAALYNNAANYNFALLSPGDAGAKAKAAAQKALEIDDNLAAAHASLAIGAYQWEWNWPEAEKEFKRALELDPNSASTYEPSPSSTNHWYAHYLMSMGRPQESLAAGRRALQLDPLDLANVSHQGWYYLFVRDWDRAIEPLQKTIEMDPRFHIGHWYLGLAYEQKGALSDAIAQFEDAVRLIGRRPSMLALLGHAYAAANRRREAQSVLDQLAALSKQSYVPAYPVAAIYAALGRKDDAFAWLEKARGERDAWMDYLKLDPRLDGLHSDPRFTELLRRVNLYP